MLKEKQDICPTCDGKKILPGTCACSQEWLGSQVDDDWENCQCTPDQECSTCMGTGYVKSD